MGLDRDELAARFAVGAYAHAHEYASDSRESIADAAVKMADALLSALSPPAAVAPVPESLDDIERSARALSDFKGAIPSGASDAFMLGWRVRDREAPCDGVARSTNAPATPAPEAKRPEWVRVTGPSNVTHVTVGKVYAVTEWHTGSPRVVNDRGERYPPGCTEYRFCGRLGFGGKYRAERNAVDCYPEDETPARRKVIDETNAALAALRANKEV